MTAVDYDPVAVDEIASTLDLRRPNRDALDALAQALDTADVGDELVADLATGVGKTYIAGGLLDYLYVQGVRNVVIVTPGSTIQKKTLGNLTPGHPKYLKGLVSDPLVVTLDDFERGMVGAALDDPDRFKVFVFTVQSLLRPNTKDNRRAHRPHEVLGQALYEYLQEQDDLVVIADEHHVYFTKNAKQFRRAVEELHPLALVGLTATPHETTKLESIVYHYPLADAIADGYVKIPVLVARSDDAADIRTQMLDGVALLDAKAAALRAYAATTHQPYIQPILFVVAQTIEEANQIQDLLVGRDFLDGAEKVLLVTSDEPDETLQLLDTLEDEHSPIRAVVSVSMLKEGWDVKNIYVIAAVRALESELLTEQILGRGLRLPYGRRTGIPMLDTVEVLSHHAFADLLREAKVLLSQTLGDRAAEAEASTVTTPGIAPTPVPLDATTPASSPTGGSQPAVVGNGYVSVTLPGAAPSDTDIADASQGTLFDLPETPENDSHQVGGISTVNARLEAGESTVEALTTIYTPREPHGFHLPLYIPRVSYRWVREPFTLASINEVEAEAYGAQFLDDNAPTLLRKLLDAERSTADGHAVVKFSDLTDVAVTASTLPIPFNEIEADLVGRIMRSNAVASTITEKNAATHLAQAFLRGAQVTIDTPWRVEHGRVASDALARWIGAKQTEKPPTRQPQIALARYPEPPSERVEYTPPADRHLCTSSRVFVRNQPYTGWLKSVYEVERFDSYSGEFVLAALLDKSDTVKAWLRITTTVPLQIEYTLGATTHMYHPDFIVADADKTLWVVEGKADSELDSPAVTAKRDAAREWVNVVNASPNVHARWAYMLAGETTIRNSTSWEVLKTAAYVCR